MVCMDALFQMFTRIHKINCSHNTLMSLLSSNTPQTVESLKGTMMVAKNSVGCKVEC